ncbi:MAG: hypothetical protein FRX49_01900 [Trebouxia sp. A1-2]|nr:MAG: hypothetical protein FRX49_01900 [Trebouxia sp. A1-2]
MVRQFKEAGADRTPYSLTNELHCKAAYGIYLQQQVEAGVPGAVEALLQSLGASTKQDEDTYLFKNQTRQLSIIDGPNADNTAPAPEHVKKKAKSAEESHQPATLSGSGKLETTVRNEVQKQLAIHREQEEKRTTFLAKAPLLRLASDILSFTLAAVLPPPTANNSIDIWSSPLAQDNQLAGHVKKMCQRNKCPVSEQRLAIEFNQIRRDKHAWGLTVQLHELTAGGLYTLSPKECLSLWNQEYKTTRGSGTP